MKTMHVPVVRILLTTVLAAGSGTSVAVDPPAPEKTVVAAAAGVVTPGDGLSEPVLFAGQASISGKVIYDAVFNAPPVLEISVDLGAVTAKGVRTGKAYVVSGQAILHRPLLAFDPVEISFSFAADGNMLLARSALASFGISYSAASGMTATPVRISQLPPA